MQYLACFTQNFTNPTLIFHGLFTETLLGIFKKILQMIEEHSKGNIDLLAIFGNTCIYYEFS